MEIEGLFAYCSSEAVVKEIEYTISRQRLGWYEVRALTADSQRLEVAVLSLKSGLSLLKLFIDAAEADD